VKNELLVNSLFYSIQGEGPRIGTPSFFIRLGGCDLDCFYCDSKETWSGQSTNIKMTIPSIVNEYVKYCQQCKSNISNIVITGGEPLIQQKEIVNLIKQMNNSTKKLLYVFPEDINFEIETNGTIEPIIELCELCPEFNVSIKLDSSNVSRSRRIKSKVIKKYVKSSESDFNIKFKFVINNETDIEEMLDLYEDFNIDEKIIYLMPEGKTQEEIQQHSLLVVDTCKKYGFKYCDRLQINIWGNKRNV